MKYVVYARKSTEDREDRQVLSINSQIEEVQRRFPELEIVEIIRESKSAYKPYNRPEFQRMVEMFQEGKVQGLLAWHPDRLSREPISGGMVMHLLDKGLIGDLRFASYHFHNSPEGKMMLAITLSQSKYSSDKQSVDVKRGMVKKCQLGSMPTKPPLGYMPDRWAEKGHKKHLQDPERFDLVRRMWDLMLTGQHTVASIVRSANEWGLTTRPTKHRPAQAVSKSTVHAIFRNPYYTGQFEWNGETYSGDYPSMVTREEFERIQEMLGGRHIPRPQKYESLTSGLIKCPCGGSVTVDHQKRFVKITGAHEFYEYARCTRQKKGQACDEPAAKLEDIEAQMEERLRNVRVSPRFHDWAMKNLKQFGVREQKNRLAELASLRKAHDEAQRRLDNLLNLKISPENSDGSLLNDQEFKERKTVETVQRDKFAKAIEEIDQRADKTAGVIQTVFDVALTAAKEFAEGSTEKKKQIISKVGANFLLKGGKLEFNAKRQYIAFEEKLPEARELEQRCEQEETSIRKPKGRTLDRLNSVWSG